jgi:hypothetical protein
MRGSDEPTVDLVFFDGCPHIEAARAALAEALGSTGRPVLWREFRSDDPELPAYAAGFGSPSVFVAGREVTGAARAQGGESCRIYSGRDGHGLDGAPDPRVIAAALLREVS